MLSFDVLDFVFLPLTGALAGFLSGLMGIGGGIVLVPALLFVFQHQNFGVEAMHVAVATSLLCASLTGFVSAYKHMQRGSVDMPMVKAWFIVGICGVLAGTYLSVSLAGANLMLAFSGLLYVLAFVNLCNTAAHTGELHIPRNVLALGGGGSMGFISGLLGIGGAVISVPVMRLAGVGLRTAIGTSAAIGAGLTGFGTVTHAVSGFFINQHTVELPWYVFGYVNAKAAVFVVMVSVITVGLGVRVAHTIPLLWLKRAFSIVTVLVASRLLMEGMHAR